VLFAGNRSSHSGGIGVKGQWIIFQL